MDALPICEGGNANACLPGETIYSILGRLRLRSGLPANELLFAIAVRNKIRVHHWLPCFIGRMGLLGLGEPQHLLRSHTLFPLFGAYADRPRRDLLKSAMLANSPLAVAHLALLPSNQVKFPSVVKCCQKCVRRDVADMGVPIWHLDHQIPGVSTCVKHDSWLQGFQLRSSGWDDLQCPRETLQSDRSSPEGITRFSEFCVDLLHLFARNPQTSFSPSLYLEKLRELGALTANGGLRRKLILREFQAFLERTWGLASAPLAPRGNTLFRVLNKQEGYRQHIYFHMLVGFWLFRSAQAVDEALQSTEPTEKDTQIASDSGKDQQRLIIQELQHGKSMNQCAKETGHGRAYIKKIARLNGVPVQERPRKMPLNAWSAVVEHAHMGQSLGEIAGKFKLSEAYVCEIVSSTPGLVEKRRHLLREQRRSQHRACLQSFLAAHPNCLRKHIKAAVGCTFYWLYRNDRQWLSGHLPAASPKVPSPRVKWDVRDREIWRQLRKARMRGATFGTWSEVDKQFGAHGWFLKCREKLPRATAFVREELLMKKSSINK